MQYFKCAQTKVLQSGLMALISLSHPMKATSSFPLLFCHFQGVKGSELLICWGLPLIGSFPLTFNLPKCNTSYLQRKTTFWCKLLQHAVLLQWVIYPEISGPEVILDLRTPVFMLKFTWASSSFQCWQEPKSTSASLLLSIVTTHIARRNSRWSPTGDY